MTAAGGCAKGILYEAGRHAQPRSLRTLDASGVPRSAPGNPQFSLPVPARGYRALLRILYDA